MTEITIVAPDGRKVTLGDDFFKCQGLWEMEDGRTVRFSREDHDFHKGKCNCGAKEE